MTSQSHAAVPGLGHGRRKTQRQTTTRARLRLLPPPLPNIFRAIVFRHSSQRTRQWTTKIPALYHPSNTRHAVGTYSNATDPSRWSPFSDRRRSCTRWWPLRMDAGSSLRPNRCQHGDRGKPGAADPGARIRCNVRHRTLIGVSCVAIGVCQRY